MLNHEKALRLWEAGAHERIAAEYLGIVTKIALRYVPGPVELDDLIGAGSIALTEALLNYDPTRGLPLQTFVGQQVNWAIANEWRDEVRRKNIGGAKMGIDVSVDTDPSIAGLTVPRVAAKHSSASDTGRGFADERQTSATRAALSVPAEEPDDVLARALAADVISPREAALVARRAQGGETWEEIGASFGTSAQAQRVVFYRARRKLRRWLNS